MKGLTSGFMALTKPHSAATRASFARYSATCSSSVSHSLTASISGPMPKSPRAALIMARAAKPEEPPHITFLKKLLFASQILRAGSPSRARSDSA